MMTASPEAPPVLTAPTEGENAVVPLWDHGLPHVRELIIHRGWHASRVVVLVPYAQMMDAGRRAWAQRSPSGFTPRFESSRNWATSLQPFVPGSTDWSGDMARDSLIAASWLDRVAGRSLDADLRATLVGRLVEATRQLGEGFRAGGHHGAGVSVTIEVVFRHDAAHTAPTPDSTVPSPL